MPWSHFTKGAFPGGSRDVFGRTARDPEGPRPGAVHFFTPRGPRATFNSNLKVTRAPARNIPRFKPVICLAGARRGPCRDPPGIRGQILKESTQDTRPGPLRDPGGSLRVLTWLVGDPGGLLPVPSRCPSGSRSVPLSGPLYNLQGDTQLLRDEFINVQSINPSINQSINLGYFSFYKLCLQLESTCIAKCIEIAQSLNFPYICG